MHTNGGDLGLLGDLIRRAGSNGKHASNIERDVLRTLSKTVGSEAWPYIGQAFDWFSVDTKPKLPIGRVAMIRGSDILCQSADAHLCHQ